MASPDKTPLDRHIFAGDPWSLCSRCDHPVYHAIHYLDQQEADELANTDKTPLDDYWYLCGACNSVSPAKHWSGPTDGAICPVCRFQHVDDDADPGIWDGTFTEMKALAVFNSEEPE